MPHFHWGNDETRLFGHLAERALDIEWKSRGSDGQLDGLPIESLGHGVHVGPRTVGGRHAVNGESRYPHRREELFR